MKKQFDYELEDQENVSFVKMKPSVRERAALNRSQAKKKPEKKTSYEASSDVQRWLQAQSFEAPTIEEKPAQPAFNPSLVASRRDADWILSSLTPLYNQKLITDVLHEARSGKEANVYCCVAHPDTGAQYLAAKIYRPRMFRSLRNDAVYRFSRMQRDEEGQVTHGNNRRGSAATRKTERARLAQVSSWIEFEYITQRLLYERGADVPQPYAHVGNAILMEYIGDVEDPAPRLSGVLLDEDEVQPLFNCIMRNIELALTHGRIHGDLSGHNILYWDGKVKLIDFAQAVDPYHNSDVFSLFLRDIKRVCQYFAQYGLKPDPRELAMRMWVPRMGPVPDFV